MSTQLMYNDGDRAFGTAADLCVQERMQVALEGLVVARYVYVEPRTSDSIESSWGRAIQTQNTVTYKHNDAISPWPLPWIERWK